MTGPLAVPDAASSARKPVRRPAPVTAAGGAANRRSHRWMLDQLPVAMLESEFFSRFVSIFQTVGSTLLEDADNVSHLADVSVTPPPFLRWLGSWIGAGALDPAQDPLLQRRIVSTWAQMVAWRGTARGLRMFLELVCGPDVEIADGGGIWRGGESPADAAYVRITVPSTGWLPEAKFVSLLQDEVPAHVRTELWIAGRLAWQSAPDPNARGPLPEPTAALPLAPRPRPLITLTGPGAAQAAGRLPSGRHPGPPQRRPHPRPPREEKP